MMTYRELEQYLFSLGDPKFAAFSKSLSNSFYLSIGVKNPVLRKIIKEHVNDNELKIDDFILGKYLEVDFIYFGLALSRLKTIDEQLDFLFNHVRSAQSWAITDVLPSYLRKCSFEKYWSLFLKLYLSSYSYDRRFAYVLGLKFYQDERVLDVLNYLRPREEYIIMMAEAWLLATIAIIYPHQIYDFLKKSDDLSLKRKTISKICDSFRVDKQTKEKFKRLR